jgi:hypothetical protein
MATLFQPCTYGMCLCSPFTSSKVNKVLKAKEAIIEIMNISITNLQDLLPSKKIYTRLATKDIHHKRQFSSV